MLKKKYSKYVAEMLFYVKANKQPQQQQTTSLTSTIHVRLPVSFPFLPTYIYRFSRPLTVSSSSPTSHHTEKQLDLQPLTNKRLTENKGSSLCFFVFVFLYM